MPVRNAEDRAPARHVTPRSPPARCSCPAALPPASQLHATVGSSRSSGQHAHETPSAASGPPAQLLHRPARRIGVGGSGLSGSAAHAGSFSPPDVSRSVLCVSLRASKTPAERMIGSAPALDDSRAAPAAPSAAHQNTWPEWCPSYGCLALLATTPLPRTAEHEPPRMPTARHGLRRSAQEWNGLVECVGHTAGPTDTGDARAGSRAGNRRPRAREPGNLKRNTLRIARATSSRSCSSSYASVLAYSSPRMHLFILREYERPRHPPAPRRSRAFFTCHQIAGGRATH